MVNYESAKRKSESNLRSFQAPMELTKQLCSSLYVLNDRLPAKTVFLDGLTPMPTLGVVKWVLAGPPRRDVVRSSVMYSEQIIDTDDTFVYWLVNIIRLSSPEQTFGI